MAAGLAAAALLAGGPAVGAPRTTVTLTAAPLPPDAVIAGFDGDPALLRVSMGGDHYVWRPGSDPVHLRQLTGIAEGARTYVASGDVLVGTVPLKDRTIARVRIDPATGRMTRLPSPVPDLPRLRLRGTDGTNLVYDTGTNLHPSGGVGLRVQPIGGTDLRAVPVPGIDVAGGGALDVTADGRALVAVTGGVAVVDLASGAVTALPSVLRTVPLTSAVLLDDTVLLVDRDGQARVRACRVSTGACTTVTSPAIETAAYLVAVADESGFVVVALQPDDTSDVITGLWTATGGAVTSRTTERTSAKAARTRTGLLVQSGPGAPAQRVDPATGARTVVRTLPQAAGSFDDARLDAGVLVTQERRADGRGTVQQRPVTGTAASGLGLGEPVDVFVTDGVPADQYFLSGAWSWRLAADGLTATVRDGGRIVGQAPSSAYVRETQGPWWIAESYDDDFGVYRGATLVRSGSAPWRALAWPMLVEGVRSSVSVRVTDLRTGVTTTVRQPARSQFAGVVGRTLLFTNGSLAGGDVMTGVDAMTGARLWNTTLPYLPGRSWLEGDVLLGQPTQRVNHYGLPAGPITATSLTTGQTTTLVADGQLLDVHEGRFAWRPAIRAWQSKVVVTALPTDLVAHRVAYLRDVLAPAAVAAGRPWAFSADADAALTTWTLTLRGPAGQTVVRTGSGPVGAVRTAWTPIAPGPWTWTLEGIASTGLPLLERVSGQVATGAITVTAP